jgi:hypothetical protein
MSSTPILGSQAKIKKGTADIGYATGVRVSIDVDLIKEYAIGSDSPAVVAAGPKTFSIDIDKMYIDNSYATDVLNGAEVDIEVAPKGTGAGNPKITIEDVIFTGWELTIEAEGVIMESVKGEGKTLTLGTYQ